MSGIAFWLLFVPLANIIFIILLISGKPTEGPNKYGEDPLETPEDFKKGINTANSIDEMRVRPERQPGAASFCPKCKDQFREGFTDCADCGVPLERFAEPS